MMKAALKQTYRRNIIGGISALMLLSASNTFAFPTSGTCAMLVTKPVPVGATIPYSNTYNILATLTFTGSTTGTVHFNAAGVTYTANGLVTSASNSETSPVGGFSFTIADGPIPGSKLVTMTDTTYNTTLTMNMVAVNSDHTILVQGGNDLFSGVCQF